MYIRIFFVPLMIIGLLVINLDSPIRSDVYLDSDTMFSMEFETDSLIEEEIQVFYSPILFTPESPRILYTTQNNILERIAHVETPPPEFF